MSATRPELRVLLLGLVFCHGAFAAGMVPILNEVLSTRAPLSFALYFGAMVAGQGIVVLMPRVSDWDRALPAFEVLFAVALLAMGALGSASGFLWGRLLEGLSSGLTLPLIFSQVMRLRAWGSAEKRTGFMNSSFALGFVVGPFVVHGVGGWLDTQLLLWSFAAIFLGIAGAMVMRPPPAGRVDEASTATLPARRTMLFPLGLAKLTYGFTLAFIGGQASAAFSLPVAWVMLGLAIIFVGGQALATVLVRAVGTTRMLQVVPLGLAVGLCGLGLTGQGTWLFVVGGFHSMLLLLGFRLFAGGPDDARTFALFNVATDPALMVGALLAGLGAPGALVIAAAGALAPLLGLRAEETR